MIIEVLPSLLQKCNSDFKGIEEQCRIFLNYLVKVMEGQEERQGIKLDKNTKISLKSSVHIFLLRVPLVYQLLTNLSLFHFYSPTLRYGISPTHSSASFHKVLYAFPDSNTLVNSLDGFFQVSSDLYQHWYQILTLTSKSLVDYEHDEYSIFRRQKVRTTL